jgi:DegV family protein with EDD domain
MKIGLVVDSSCDLPSSFFEEECIELMPTTLKMGDQTFDDRRNERQTITFYSKQMDQKIDVLAESFPYSSEQIEKLFLDKLVRKYDHVFCLTVMQSRSNIYENAMKASIGILGKYQNVRSDAGLDGHFALAVINGRNIFTGTAILAAEVIRMIKTGAAPSAIDSRIREMVPHTYCYMVPPDLEHIYKRASKRGDKSINWASFMLGSMLDIKPILLGHMDETRPVAKLRRFDAAVETMLANATRAVEAGLLAPAICIGYGGDTAKVQDMPGFPQLKEAATKAGVTIHIAPMSITAGAHTGPGCLTVAFISDKHIFEEKV